MDEKFSKITEILEKKSQMEMLEIKKLNKLDLAGKKNINN
jgi:hypothetical protein